MLEIMLKLNDFILLKALFDEKLSSAILSNDTEAMVEIIESDYNYEKYNGFIKDEPLNPQFLFDQHQRDNNDDELKKTML